MGEAIEKLDKILDLLDTQEKKINRIYKEIEEIKKTIGIFLDNQSQREDFAGRDAGFKNKNDKKPEAFSIDSIPEDERPPNWDFEMQFKSGKSYSLWELYQTKKGRQKIQTILSMEDEDNESLIKYQKKIKEFRPLAKNLMKKLYAEQKSNNDNEQGDD